MALYSLRGAGTRCSVAEVLRVAALEFPPAQFVAVIRENGAGKSTRLGMMAGLKDGYFGECRYQGSLRIGERELPGTQEIEAARELARLLHPEARF